jgi:beta-glucosidase-like glycosyl hydrolase
MEGSTEVGVSDDRNHVDTAITMQDLMDSYLPPFQSCVEEGRVTSLMCSYNAVRRDPPRLPNCARLTPLQVNGVPSCANDWLLNTVARDGWDFDGAIVSDCDADRDVFESHHYTDTPEESVRDVLRAGTDVDCGRTFAHDPKLTCLSANALSLAPDRLRQGEPPERDG